MSTIRTKVFAAIAALALAGGSAALAATSATAATPSCGAKCLDVFSKQFGSYTSPQFVMDVLRQGEKVNQPVILFRQSNSDPAEDFTYSEQGQVSDFYAAGLVSAQFDLHYGCNWDSFTNTCGDSFPDLYAFEVQYAPYGVNSGLCVGLASTAVSGEKVTLQPCGVTSRTVWAVDTLDSCVSNPLYSLEAQVINGSDNNFSLPYVMEYPASSYPTDTPRPQLYVNNLTGFSTTGGSGSSAACGGLAVTGPDTNQLWGAVEGVLP